MCKNPGPSKIPALLGGRRTRVQGLSAFGGEPVNGYK